MTRADEGVNGQLTALGIDPGPSTGLALACWENGKLAWAHAAQCDAGLAPDLLRLLLGLLRPSLGGIEAFVPGAHSGTSAGDVTRQLIRELGETAAAQGLELRERTAGLVKPWATDTRLKAAGLLALTPGSAHARDACRHLLYTACSSGGLADPLSRRRPARGERP